MSQELKQKIIIMITIKKEDRMKN